MSQDQDGDASVSGEAGFLLVAALLALGGLGQVTRPPRGAPWPDCPLPVLDGELVRCDGRGRELPARLALLLGVRVDLNRASADELEALPGIGPVLAQRLVAARAERGGRFRSLDELAEVPGIGPRMVQRLAPLVELR